MEGRSSWRTVQVMTWRVMCEGDATNEFETGPFPHEEFDQACEALEEARSDHPTHCFYLVAEIDA